ncbi:hypothetical protein KIL84_000233 [Mauremys mutica]|uniref:Uncharacterized protein n=1 Tax=Mauremys mutica TaxID=74926 RepID=A0A9D4AWF7_9SAUR|nr:hypothetical protein KIL84_000233 [Mauremys mutica]
MAPRPAALLCCLGALLAHAFEQFGFDKQMGWFETGFRKCLSPEPAALEAPAAAPPQDFRVRWLSGDEAVHVPNMAMELSSRVQEAPAVRY